MVIGLACRRYRGLLEALVEQGERTPATELALDHLAGCAACEREMTELALTIAALRRTGREVRRAPVPKVAASRIAALATPRRSPWSWRLQLGGLLTGAAIAAVIVAPRLGFAERQPDETSAPAHPAVTATWRLAETRLAAAPDTPSFAAAGAVPPRYPEGLSRPWKEVSSSDASPRAFEPL